jgi:hypothetical protein
MSIDLELIIQILGLIGAGALGKTILDYFLFRKSRKLKYTKDGVDVQTIMIDTIEKLGKRNIELETINIKNKVANAHRNEYIEKVFIKIQELHNYLVDINKLNEDEMILVDNHLDYIINIIKSKVK